MDDGIESAEEQGQEDRSSEDGNLNAADPASVERASKRAAVWKAQRRQLWRSILSTEIGRRAIWEFLTLECNFGNVPMALSPSGHPDFTATMYWNGVKRVGEKFFEMLQRADHEAVYQMRLENDPEYVELRPKRSR